MPAIKYYELTVVIKKVRVSAISIPDAIDKAKVPNIPETNGWAVTETHVTEMR